MRTVWKYTLQTMIETLNMPEGAQILSVANQFNSVCLWASVDTNAPSENRRFYVVGTGHPLPEEPTIYRGTAKVEIGHIVLHVFEATAKE